MIMEGDRLFEREDGLSLLSAVIERARGGTLSAGFVVGEAGLGKTALLNRCAREAEGFRVCRAHGEASAVALPFGFLNEALSTAGFLDLLRSPKDLSFAERTFWSWDRLRTWLERDSEPLLLCLDDLHWADADSLSLVTLLVRHLSNARVAIVATLRPHPERAFREVEPLASAPRENVDLLRLEPLTPGGAEALIEGEIGRSLDEVERRRSRELCAGNPLLLRELASRIRVDDGEFHIPGTGLSASQFLLTKFAGMGGCEMEYARAASVFGVTFRPGAVQRLVGFDHGEAVASLDALCSAGLVRSIGDEFVGFTHALFREALYCDVAVPVRDQLHAEAFRILWEFRVPSGEAAEHAVKARLTGDALALEATHRAGIEALESGAFDQAKGWLHSFVALSGSRIAPEERLQLAREFKEAGAAQDALELATEVVASAEVPRKLLAEATRIMARCEYETGDAARASESFERSARLMAGVDPALAAETLVEGSLISLYGSGPLRASEFADLATELLGSRIDPDVDGWFKIARGQARLLLAEPEAADELHAAIEALRTDDVAIRGYRGSIEWGPRLVELQTAKMEAKFDEALKIYEVAIAEAKKAVAPFAMSVLGVAQADTLTRVGRLLDARETLNAAIENAPWMAGRAPWAMVGLAHVNFELDEMAESHRLCNEIAELIGENRRSQPALRCWLNRVRSALARSEHDLDGACGFALVAEEIAADTGIYEPCSIPWHSAAIAAHSAAGRAGDLVGVLDRIEWATKRVRCRWPRALLARGRALLALLEDNAEVAEANFEAALGYHDGLSMPIELVETLIPYGAFLRKKGDLGGARTHLREALKISSECGALRLKGVAERELHLAGGRRRKEVVRGVLTPMEIRVAEMASLGLTNLEIGNQMFISPRTVEHHLGRVYSNLGITSRRDLIRLRRSGKEFLDLSVVDAQRNGT